jgi:hypothetical protein
LRVALVAQGAGLKTPLFRRLRIRVTDNAKQRQASLATRPHLHRRRNNVAACLPSLLRATMTRSDLQHLKNLQTLDLGRTAITDTGLIFLKDLKQLKKLAVFCVGVTKSGVLELQKSLPRTPIRYLDAESKSLKITAP